MRDAAVGFQCPDCIAEGRRTTRQARTAYGGLRPGSVGVVSKTLIGINAAVWVLILATGGQLEPPGRLSRAAPEGRLRGGSGRLFAVSHAQCSAGGGTWLPGLADGAWWQPVTSMFAHVEVLHIGFNMVALWFLGPQLEMVLGRARFLGSLPAVRPGRLGGGVPVHARVHLQPGCLRRDLRADGRPARVAHKARADISQLLVWIGINAALTFFAARHLLAGATSAASSAAWPWPASSSTPRASGVRPWQAAGFGVVGVAVVVAIVLRTAALDLSRLLPSAGVYRAELHRV